MKLPFKIQSTSQPPTVRPNTVVISRRLPRRSSTVVQLPERSFSIWAMCLTVYAYSITWACAAMTWNSRQWRATGSRTLVSATSGCRARRRRGPLWPPHEWRCRRVLIDACWPLDATLRNRRTVSGTSAASAEIHERVPTISHSFRCSSRFESISIEVDQLLKRSDAGLVDVRDPHGAVYQGERST